MVRRAQGCLVPARDGHALFGGVRPVFESHRRAVEQSIRPACDIARGHKRVVADPPAVARVKQLGDHGIELELTVWIADPAVGEGDMRSEILKDVLKRFRSAGIEIPYPRRDIRIIATPETPESPLPSRV